MIHMSENRDYYKELYVACNYIIDPIETFKDYVIYDFVTYEKEQNYRGEVALKLHNRFLAQFKFLIGESENKFSHIDPKGAEIMPKIDYQSLNTIKLAKMLAITDHFINEDSMHINYQMSKINVDKTIPIMDYLVEQIISTDEYNKFGQWREYLKKGGMENIPEIKEYFKSLEIYYVLKRKELIRDYKYFNFNGVYDYYRNLSIYAWLQTNDKREEIGENIISDTTPCAKLEAYFNVWLYVDLGCKSILQYIIQRIIKNKENKDKLTSIRKLNDAILFYLKIGLMEYNSAELEKVKLEKRPEEDLFKIYFYYIVRDNLLQDTKNLKKFTEFKNTNTNSTIKRSVSFLSQKGKKNSWENIQNIFEEGYEKRNVKTFKKNVVNCLLLIKKINMAVRESDIPYSPIRLKTLYREFYLEKPKYGEGRKTGMTILNEFLKRNDMQNAEYYYIREILNRGLFAEYGLLEEFYAKNELQENLYQAACLCLAKLDPKSVKKNFDDFISLIFDIIRDLESKCNNYVPIPEEEYKDIGDFDLPVDCNNMTNEEIRKSYLLLEDLFGISE